MRAVRAIASLTLTLAVAASAVAGPREAVAQSTELTLPQADSIVRQARVLERAGRFAEARALLGGALPRCGATRSSSECRKMLSSATASLYQSELRRSRSPDSALRTTTVGYWDRVLVEDSTDADALFGKAQLLRNAPQADSLSSASFLRLAADRDPSRRAAYLSFLGDRYMSNRDWKAATNAFSQAVAADPDEEAARSGLIEALRRLGPGSVPELLSRARMFELRDVESAADAYSAALSLSLRSAPPDSLRADSAYLGLVGVQARSGRVIGVVPSGVSSDWLPARELRVYMESARLPEASWWLASEGRRTTLSQAALARGGQAVGEGNHEFAEHMWGSGIAYSSRGSGARLDIQRELALLYFRRPDLDPDQGKWQRLESELFGGKGSAIESGDLQATQRIHTALGVIYAARGQWRREDRARNASDQLTWALEAADERHDKERFWQPLPELRATLARGLDSTGYRSEAANVYMDAVAAALDTYDGDEVESLAQAATRNGGGSGRLDRLLNLARFRSALARSEALDASLCTTQNARVVDGTGRRDFEMRQQFKIFADCTLRGGPAARIQWAVRAFPLVDETSLTLIGGADVARFEQVMQALLGTVGMEYRTDHLDRVRTKGDTALAVTLPGESMPRWLSLDADQMLAARIVTALSGNTAGFRLRVISGAVEVQATSKLSDELVRRIARVKGAVSVRVVEAPGQ